jgi:hypothetical protein
MRLAFGAKLSVRWLASLAAVFVASSSTAQPGMGNRVYGARVEAGATEIESSYSRLAGGAAGGQDVLLLEFAHGFSRGLAAGLQFEFEHIPGRRRALESVGVEGLFALGRLEELGLDVGIYAEYELVFDAADELEAALILQRSRWPFEARLNLVLEQELKRGRALEIGYAGLADWELTEGLRLGVQAFGELGTHRRLLTRAEHFAGPVLRSEIEGLPAGGELEIELSYLRALGAARDDADGQLRLVLEYQFSF